METKNKLRSHRRQCPAKKVREKRQRGELDELRAWQALDPPRAVPVIGQAVRPEKEAMALRIEGLEGEVRHWQAEYHTKVLENESLQDQLRVARASLEAAEQDGGSAKDEAASPELSPGKASLSEISDAELDRVDQATPGGDSLEGEGASPVRNTEPSTTQSAVARSGVVGTKFMGELDRSLNKKSVYQVLKKKAKEIKKIKLESHSSSILDEIIDPQMGSSLPPGVMTSQRTRTPTKAYLAYMEQLKDEDEKDEDIYKFNE